MSIKPADTNSLNFFEQKGNPGAMNRVLFAARVIFTAPGQSFPLTTQNSDLPFGKSKHVFLQIKDIIASLYLPICLNKSDGSVFEPFSDVKAIYEQLIFILTINGKSYEYPVVFTKNGESVISSNYYSTIRDPIKSMSCKVIGNFFSDQFLNYPHYVALNVESFIMNA